jgi:hypothetical protein
MLPLDREELELEHRAKCRRGPDLRIPLREIGGNSALWGRLRRARCLQRLDRLCHYLDSSARSGAIAMALEKELATYTAKLPELKDKEGKFVLIHGEEVVDFFSTYEDAIQVGYSRFGLESFLVKQIQTIEQVQFVSRFVDPCAHGRAV